MLSKEQFMESCIGPSTLEPGRQVASGDRQELEGRGLNDRQELEGRGLTNAFYVASITNDDVHRATLVYFEVLQHNQQTHQTLNTCSAMPC